MVQLRCEKTQEMKMRQRLFQKEPVKCSASFPDSEQETIPEISHQRWILSWTKHIERFLFTQNVPETQ